MVGIDLDEPHPGEFVDSEEMCSGESACKNAPASKISPGSAHARGPRLSGGDALRRLDNDRSGDRVDVASRSNRAALFTSLMDPDFHQERSCGTTSLIRVGADVLELYKSSSGARFIYAQISGTRGCREMITVSAKGKAITSRMAESR